MGDDLGAVENWSSSARKLAASGRSCGALQAGGQWFNGLAAGGCRTSVLAAGLGQPFLNFTLGAQLGNDLFGFFFLLTTMWEDA